MKLNGSEILINTLLEQEVDVIFGYPGGAVLNIYDSLYHHSDKIRHIVTSHEQGACHAADAYARVTGRPGVVLATSGPGASNIVTGIANAYMDSVPIVAITGNVPNDLIGRDSFQEIDIAGITMPITKNNYIVTDVSQLANVVRDAFKIAMSGRPGPVLIDIAKDVTAAMGEYEPKPKMAKRPLPIIEESEIEAAVKMITASKKPMIYAGGGVTFSDASENLVEFAEKIDCPVATSMMGLSCIPSAHKLNLGMIGMHGTPVSNIATTECDLIIAVGVRFSDRVAGNRELFGKDAKIIHIDIDRSEHCKNVYADLCIYGDSKKILDKLTEAVYNKKHDEWTAYLEEYNKAHPLHKAYGVDGEANLRDVLEEIDKNSGDDTIIVTDVGQHQMITAQYYNFKKPRTFISSCGLGTMGFGLGAAIGAKVASPKSDVILITGDGSFHMNLQEMACAVSEELAVKTFVINNGVLGMVRQWQSLFYAGRYSNTTLQRKTNFPKLAEAFGAKGYRAESCKEVQSTVRAALREKGPVIAEFVINIDDGVFPIIPPGKSAKDMILFE